MYLLFLRLHFYKKYLVNTTNCTKAFAGDIYYTQYKIYDKYFYRYFYFIHRLNCEYRQNTCGAWMILRKNGNIYHL